MEIKRIAPEELPAYSALILKRVYETGLNKFTIIGDRKTETLFVNKGVPQKDIDGFLEVVTFPDYAVANPDSKTGKILEHVYRKYGFSTYRILLDLHDERRKQEEKRRAREAAKHIIPLIEKEVNNRDSIVEYDEFLAYEVWKAGYSLDRCTEKNASNYGSVYEFYLGYLMGAGMLKGGAI